ncbi:hypothetical protein CXB51_034592 [Gossypium anomalum]|uniref:Uncharacterized protein n=1 Tax=Gossypium anomalum TaxID=47600 RepID=A0A8J6CF43_9ROSI|nr:hypothetical protein CXB51_034592 [Gossypium anomalum]
MVFTLQSLRSPGYFLRESVSALINCFGESFGSLKCSLRLRFSARELATISYQSMKTLLISVKISQPSARDARTRLIDGKYDRCIDWLEDTLRVLDSKATADFFTLLWNVWNNRNKLVFQDKEDPAMVVGRRHMC